MLQIIPKIVLPLCVSFAVTGCGGGEEVASVADQSSTAMSVKAVAVLPTTSTLNPLPTDAIFSPTSFWYQQIPVNTPLHANSAGFVADFLRQKVAYYNTVGVNTTAYASPVYSVPAAQPTKKINQWQCMPNFALNPGLAQQWAAVPWPDYAQPAAGSDAEMTIYQKSSDSLWEFWQTRNTSGQWVACWGGKMSNVSQSDGRWPSIYGTTATGLPFLGGQVTAEELARGEIRHAIGIALPEVEAASTISWPAMRGDGSNPQNAANRIPQGMRLRLDPSVNVDALNLRPATKVIAKAAQKYGFVVWDKSGAIGIRVQNPKSYTAMGQVNPYPALFNNAPEWAWLEGIPWNKLQFMPMNYGKP